MKHKLKYRTLITTILLSLILILGMGSIFLIINDRPTTATICVFIALACAFIGGYQGAVIDKDERTHRVLREHAKMAAYSSINNHIATKDVHKAKQDCARRIDMEFDNYLDI